MILQYELATSGIVNTFVNLQQTVLKRHVREHVSTCVQECTLKSKTFWFSCKAVF